jgi:hypothetical protein
MFKPKHALGLVAGCVFVAAQWGLAASYTFDKGAGNMNWDAGTN